MILKSLLCLFLLALYTNASNYFIDADFQVYEMSDAIDDYLFYNEQVLATSSFTDDHNTTGWAYYKVQTNGAYPDWLQTYTAGYMEGYLAYELIYDVYSNLKSVRSNENDVPTEVLEYMNNQTVWMVKQVAQNPNDHYWNLVNATLAQQAGMYAGYLVAIAKHMRPDMALTYEQLYQISYLAEYWDVFKKFNTSTEIEPSCSFLLKITDDDMYVSHTTWTAYISLIRMYKVLNFNLHNPLVKTKKLIYSANPGAVPSKDDFYILDNNRFVSETSLSAHNYSVYEYLHYDTLPYWVRITVANLVFDTMQNWVDTFFKFRSGTYNNQWILVDFNNYNASKSDLSQAKDIVWMAEEFFSLTSVQDVTQALLVPQGYFASYNVPYNASILALSQNPTNFTNDPRAILFAKYAPGIQNLDDFKTVMRMNNHSDTGNYCEAIASRCDLQNADQFPRGAIDCKVTSNNMITTQQAWIIAGPTTTPDVPPFTWDSWPQYQSSRKGMPTVYDFDWVFVDPNNNFTSPSQFSDGVLVDVI